MEEIELQGLLPQELLLKMLEIQVEPTKAIVEIILLCNQLQEQLVAIKSVLMLTQSEQNLQKLQFREHKEKK